jgi:hypothetical protein
MSKRWTAITAVAAVVLIELAAVPASSAKTTAGSTSQTPLVTCTVGTWSAEVNPYLTLVPKPAIFTQSYAFTNCVDPLNLLQTAAKASWGLNMPNMSCLNILTPQPLTATITWKDPVGATSTVAATHLVLAGTFVAIGSVTSGLYAGKSITITEQTFPVVAPVECLTSGLWLATGSATLVIV